MKMNEHVARKLCRASSYNPNHCLFCDDDEENNVSNHNGECQLWASFLNEADAAIKAVKDYAILSLRSKPKI